MKNEEKIPHRRADADRERPFRIPGGMPLAFMITAVCVAILAISILLFMYIPGEGFDMPVVIGAAVSILLGEIAIRYAEHESRA